MGDLIEGDDGLPVEEVGAWAKVKINSLCRYIAISRGVRAKWLGPHKGGATYIDLFCGPGRAKIRRTGEFIDGSCVAAWNESVRSETPFSRVFIADADIERRGYAAERLRRLGAPVFEVPGDATEAAKALETELSSRGLHFAFIDPYNLGAFNFAVVRSLAKFKYIDMLVHVSKMDLQRNVGLNVAAQRSAFDHFAPGWREGVDLTQRHSTIRRSVFEYWRRQIAALGVFTSTDLQLITGDKGQHLYWLTLASRSDLAHRFWSAASQSPQRLLEL